MNWQQAREWMRANPGSELLTYDDADLRIDRRLHWRFSGTEYQVLAKGGWSESFEFNCSSMPDRCARSTYEPLHPSPKPALTLEQALTHRYPEHSNEVHDLLVAEVKRLQSALTAMTANRDEWMQEALPFLGLRKGKSVLLDRVRARYADSLELAKLQRDEWRDEVELLQRKYDRAVVGGNEALERVTDQYDAIKTRYGFLESTAKANSDYASAHFAEARRFEVELERVTAERDAARQGVDGAQLSAALARVSRVEAQLGAMTAERDAARQVNHDNAVYTARLDAQLATLRTAAERQIKSLEVEPDEDGDTQTSAYLRLKYALDSIGQVDTNETSGMPITAAATEEVGDHTCYGPQIAEECAVCNPDPSDFDTREQAHCATLAAKFCEGGEETFDFQEEFEEMRDNLSYLIKREREAARTEATALRLAAESVRADLDVCRKHYDSVTSPTALQEWSLTLQRGLSGIAPKGTMVVDRCSCGCDRISCPKCHADMLCEECHPYPEHTPSQPAPTSCLTDLLSAVDELLEAWDLNEVEVAYRRLGRAVEAVRAARQGGVK